MTNLHLILLVGGLLGWSFAATKRDFRISFMVRHVLSGALGSFAGALFAQGGTLYGALGPMTWAGAVSGALILTGLIGLIPALHRR